MNSNSSIKSNIDLGYVDFINYCEKSISSNNILIFHRSVKNVPPDARKNTDSHLI